MQNDRIYLVKTEGLQQMLDEMLLELPNVSVHTYDVEREITAREDPDTGSVRNLWMEMVYLVDALLGTDMHNIRVVEDQAIFDGLVQATRHYWTMFGRHAAATRAFESALSLAVGQGVVNGKNGEERAGMFLDTEEGKQLANVQEGLALLLSVAKAELEVAKAQLRILNYMQAADFEEIASGDQYDEDDALDK